MMNDVAPTKGFFHNKLKARKVRVRNNRPTDIRRVRDAWIGKRVRD
jgi:hypothetical protein